MTTGGVKPGRVIGYTVLSQYGEEWAPDLDDVVDRKTAHEYAKEAATLNYTPRQTVVAKIVAVRAYEPVATQGKQP